MAVNNSLANTKQTHPGQPAKTGITTFLNTEDVSDIVDGRIKAAAERDVYKELYMYLLDRAISA